MMTQVLILILVINQDKITSVDNNAEEDKADFSRDNDSEGTNLHFA